jgi:glycosyltransferase involved in cell wall biosynthesis
MDEGLGIALLEAMSSGLPVVASRVGGIPELVEDGVSGHLAPAGDDEALAAALRRLIAAPDRWEAMGRAGRARVEDEYSMDRATDSLERNFEEVLS